MRTLELKEQRIIEISKILSEPVNTLIRNRLEKEAYQLEQELINANTN